MKMLTNLETGVMQIKLTLQADEELRKLIYYDIEDPLSNQAPSRSAVEEHIVLSPVFDVTKEPYDKNTMLSVMLEKGTWAEKRNFVNGIVKVNVFTRTGLWSIANGKIRPLSIANIVIDLLNQQKITTSHKLAFDNLTFSVINDDITGYTITFFMLEGSGLENEF